MQVETFVQNHPGWILLAWVVQNMAYYIFMCAVQSLPRPGEADTRSYVFWFGFLHRLSANWERAKLARANEVRGGQGNAAGLGNGGA